MRKTDYQEIATRVGLLLGDLDYLSQGRATTNLAARLQLNIGEIESFISGGHASAAIQGWLGLATLAAADDVMVALTREQRIAFVYGRLFS